MSINNVIVSISVSIVLFIIIVMVHCSRRCFLIVRNVVVRLTFLMKKSYLLLPTIQIGNLVLFVIAMGQLSNPK